MAGDLRLSGFAVPEGIEALHDLLERVGSEHPDLAALDLSMFETAVIEIANNVVEHGLPPGEVRWSFAVEVRPDRVVGVLTDDGQALPEGRPVADAEMPDVLAEDGRGLPLAHAVLDELDYTRDGRTNVWTMVRRRS
ncbi:ATP-binding protein [Phycicoccus sp. CSK15P-2]|uniref:ATP-binding protein n=1 Tax=Phycicoccus sp. CSK15P-2 TaxID=2807627 RepID=UPI001950AC3F|nr:ATP-binding protein [Phycicoccus sp. CSK15P-2]MBM6405292.1 ATP-binding protein [Phycicoccus sp. CSK15P-2]